MKLKDLIRSPWYIATLILCIVLICILLIVVTHNQNGQVSDMPDAETSVSHFSLDDIMNHVCLASGVTTSEIANFHIICNNGNSASLTYNITLTYSGHTYHYKAEQSENGEIIVSSIVHAEDKVKDELPDNAEETTPKIENDSPATYVPSDEFEEKLDDDYISTMKIKENVLLDALLTEADVDFVTIKLSEKQAVPIYEVVFETKDKYRKYIYQVNASTGLLRSRTYYNADDLWDEENIFMKQEGQNAKWYDEIWEEGIPDGKRGNQSFYDEPIYE